MKNVVIKYGSFSTLLLVVLMSLSFFMADDSNYSVQEIIGYSSMVISMVFVFLGIRYYRDYERNSEISFVQALKLGLLIALVPSVAFGVFDVVYTEFINPDFMENYQQYYVEQMKGTMSEEEFEVAVAQMKSQMEMFQNPVAQFFIMGLTVFLIGIVASLLSALVLKK